MSKTELHSLISSQPFLKALSPKHISLLEECAHIAEFNQGDYLARAETPANAFYVILKGQIAIELAIAGKGALIIQTLLPNELFGWSWIFPPFQWQFDGRATQPVKALVFNGACLRAKCDADPELGYTLMKLFAQLMTNRLKATRLQLLDIYGST